MWNNYIKIIKTRDDDYTMQEYCIWFAANFSLNLYSLNEFSLLIEKENGKLLPITKNISDNFYNANLDFMINFIYHLNELKNLDFLIMDNVDSLNYDKMFKNKDSSLYFFRLFSLDNEILLSQNNNNNTLLFLFFYFFPKPYKCDLLFHHHKKFPLISCNKITFYHFEMLLFLMKSFEQITFNNLCNGYNLNLILIEDFCQSATQLYNDIDDNYEWFDILPIDKMKTLFLNNCEFKNFIDFRNHKVYYTVPTLEKFINYLQKDFEFHILKEKLDNKDKIKIEKNKLIKI